MHRNVFLLIVNALAITNCQRPNPELIDFGPYDPVDSPASNSDAGVPDGGATENAPSLQDPEESRQGCEEAAPNLLRNGAFEYRPIHACGWYTFDATDWGVIAAPYCVADDHPSCAVYLASEVWGDHWVSQFYQPVALECGAIYEFSFEAKAAGVTRPLLVAILGGGPLRDAEGELDLGAGIELELGTEWQSYSFSFTATEYAEESIVDFGIGGADTGLYIDNVMLIRESPPNLGPAPALPEGALSCVRP